MPEYLSPGVYMEEFEIGAKPIEGVSTSTAGFVGMTEKGPLNKPTLVTSFAEYQRIFGDYLSGKSIIKDGQEYPEYGENRFLPYAVEGFFNNGGQRAYIIRVTTDNAAASKGFLPDISGMTAILVREVNINAITLKVDNATGLTNERYLLLKDGPHSEYLTFVKLAKELTLNTPLEKDYDQDTTIIKMNEDKEYIFEAALTANIDVFQLNNVNGLEPDNVLTINDSENPEICIIKSISGSEITVKKPLRFDHDKDVTIFKLTPSVSEKKIISAVKAQYTVVPIIDKDTDFIENNYMKIGDEYFFITGVDKENIILVKDELKYKHEMGKELKELVPTIVVTASNEGTWGDKIKIEIQDSSLSNAKLTKKADSGKDYLDLNTLTGMEKGTILKIQTNGNQEIYGTVNEVVKTEDISRVYLEESLSVTINAANKVSTVEFDVKVISKDLEENFKLLSMYKDHSRYFEKIITEKSSRLIKVEDVSETADPSKKMPMIQDKNYRWKLEKGNDGIPKHGIYDIYEGKDSEEPRNRTGIHTLKNIDGISIVAIPGIFSQQIQNKHIIHCEKLNRFAVLDAEGNVDLDTIQTQRKLYDSKYAAIYYPWIRVFDPISKDKINVPPSGHVCGIYARSDTQRGVHKAPANEKVYGALGLEKLIGRERIITKGQQDILNPMGVNCIRAFNGLIKVWGARTISSDSLWKYINVRRLFIYVEDSIEKSTQWVVFEPNDEKLWARVRATITQFLARVWKDGALMGTKVEEAFFIKCDRTTMTQDDIDNGRLICVIGIAPVKPAEFVIFRIAQWQGGSSATE